MSICLNGFILSLVIIGIYVTALHHYLGVVFLSDILSLKNPGGGSLGDGGPWAWFGVERSDL